MSEIDNGIKLVRWAKESLHAHQYSIKGEPEVVVTTPYSSVSRFITSKGIVYLKKMPPKLSSEAIITRLLPPEKVPSILDENKALHCFLMLDAGQSLRAYLKNNFHLDLLSAAITTYDDLQREVAPQVSDFIKLGIPDWRLATFPHLYQQLLAAPLLQEEGLDIDTLKKLQDLSSNVFFLCQQLAAYQTPESLSHCDFHTNNVLIDAAHHLTIIDWAESAIAHTFFSIISCLNQAVIHHALNSADRAYLESQLHYPSDAMPLAKRLWPLYAAFGYYRLMRSCDAEELKTHMAKRPHRLGNYLKLWIEQEARGL